MDKQWYVDRYNCESLIVGIIPRGNCPFYPANRLSIAFSQQCPQGTRDRTSYRAWKDIFCWNGPFRHPQGRKRPHFHCNSGSILSRQLDYFVYSHKGSRLLCLAIWICVPDFSRPSWCVDGEMLFLYFPLLCSLCGKLQQVPGVSNLGEHRWVQAVSNLI